MAVRHRGRLKLVIVEQYTFPQPLRQRQDYAYIQHLAEWCERVDIICSNVTSEAAEDVDGPIRIHLLPVAQGAVGSLRFLREGLCWVHRLEREVRPDLYMIRETLTSTFLGWWAQRLAGIPWVVELRNDFYHLDTMTHWSPLKRRLMAFLTTQSCRRATRIRAVSKVLVDSLLAAGVPSDRIVNLPTPIDVARFEPSELQASRARLRAEWGWQDRLILLFSAGQLPTGKGIGLLLQALARVRHKYPETTLLILSDGYARKSLEAQAEALGVAHAVLFNGFVPYDLVPGYFAACDAFVLPSLSEGLPRAAREAGACGLPLILSRVGGNPEVVVPGSTGWLVDLTVESLAAAICDLGAMSRPERRAMGARSRAFICERFAIEQAVPAIARDLLLTPVAEFPRRG